MIDIMVVSFPPLASPDVAKAARRRGQVAGDRCHSAADGQRRRPRAGLCPGAQIDESQSVLGTGFEIQHGERRVDHFDIVDIVQIAQLHLNALSGGY